MNYSDQVTEPDPNPNLNPITPDPYPDPSPNSDQTISNHPDLNHIPGPEQTIEEARAREVSFKSYFAEVKDQLKHP